MQLLKILVHVAKPDLVEATLQLHGVCIARRWISICINGERTSGCSDVGLVTTLPQKHFSTKFGDIRSIQGRISL